MTVSDRPGGIAELAKAISACGVSIKDMVHERAWVKNDIFSVEVRMLTEDVISQLLSTPSTAVA